MPARLENKAADNDLKDATHTTAQKTNLGVLQTATGDYVNKEKWLMFRPHLEVFHTGKVLVPHMEMKIQFHFNDPDFWTYGRIRDDAANKSIQLLPEDIESRFILSVAIEFKPLQDSKHRKTEKALC